ncbi:2,3-diaminopropionate biosynthesis protein SbnB [Undibacterium sp. SXout7W]|uniref:2,3-diaminopropionate biosynthesis protein SbnB n=1 Tax=Undibacterium sp. SXout7W TaxID=3413049 RepID=UPI003BF42DD4
MISPSTLFVVPGRAIADLLSKSHANVIGVVRDTYLAHGAAQTINPDSYFLRFDDKPEARIIALPAALKGDRAVSGIKWIASYPSNIRVNLQRASATLILNDYETGYPIAFLEASQISAARTAASAVLGAEVLGNGKHAKRLAVVGAGVIARTIIEYFHANSWSVESLVVHDLNQTDASHLARAAEPLCASAVVAASLDEALQGASHVVFATTAVQPYIHNSSWLTPRQIILNISLRDLAPEILIGSTNIFDDVEHCMKASTSPHLAEQLTGNRDFVAGTLADVISGNLDIDDDKPIIFSPFGLGVLDVALGHYLLERACLHKLACPIEGFFPDTARW